jgi:peptidoglycan/LPS O-acetylase OafA/YrhL
VTQVGGDRSARIPSLDGLRAISIVLVVISHAARTRGFPSLGRMAWLTEKCGEFGVIIFFVISGFLITSLLLREIAANGRISLRDFYLRRSCRIFPVYFVYLAVILMLAALGFVVLRPNDALFALTLTMNYHYDRSWITGHAWSLSVEEQFYLLWPAVMAFGGPRRRAQIAFAVLLIAPVARVVSSMLQRHLGYYVGVGQTFPTVADALAVGCLLALWRDRLDRFDRYNAFLRSRWFALVPLTAAMAMLGTRVVAFDHTIAHTIINVAVCITLDRCVRLPGGVLIRLLNSRAAVLLGMLSYSIYIWQQPFLSPENTSPILGFPFNLCFVFPVAAASYVLIEKPFVKLRLRLQARLPAKGPSAIADGTSPGNGDASLFALVGPAMADDREMAG